MTTAAPIERPLQDRAGLLAYRELARKWPNFATKRIARPGDIFPVFRELFSKQRGVQH